MEITTKYNMEIRKDGMDKYLYILKNRIYKLLPLREENLEWKKHLLTIEIEITGLNDLVGGNPNFISLISKLEALNSLDDFMAYRKTIFECLNIIEDLS